MNVKKEHWKKEDYQAFLDYLESNSDETYKKFHSSLVPDLKDFYGCRVPFLKQVGKEISKGNYQEFLKLNQKKMYEEKFVYGMVISSIKIDFNKRLDYLREFIPIIDNWAICDSFCANLKDFRKNREEGFQFIRELLKKEDTYSIRVALVLLLDHYINENYLHIIFKITDEIKSDEYYVNMAVAWVISTCYIKYPKDTLTYLKQSKLDPWTYNKSISKICESLRVSKEEKLKLKKFKRKMMTSRELKEYIKDHGVTLSSEFKPFIPSHGYMVCIKNSSKKLSMNMNLEVLLKNVNEYYHRFYRPSVYIGIYIKEDTFWITQNIYIKNLEEAIALGKENHQDSIWSFKDHNIIEL